MPGDKKMLHNHNKVDNKKKEKLPITSKLQNAFVAIS